MRSYRKWKNFTVDKYTIMETNVEKGTNEVYRSIKGTPVTDSQKVAKVFGKKNKDVMRTIRNIMNTAQNCAVHNWFYESTYIADNGKANPMIVMNRDGFSLLAMGLTGAKAMQFKIGFIDMFDRMENAISESQSALPQSFAQALRLAASQAEKMEEQQRQLVEQAPRVLFSQAVETSRQSVLIGELAKMICQNGVATGEKRLFQWMRDNHFLCAHGERYNEPTQKAMEMGLFELKKVTITIGGDIKVRSTTKVTGKGQIFFVNRFLTPKKENILYLQ